jgi:hypothetical protein
MTWRFLQKLLGGLVRGTVMAMSDVDAHISNFLNIHTMNVSVSISFCKSKLRGIVRARLVFA